MPDVTASHIIDFSPPPPDCLIEVVAVFSDCLLSLGLWAKDFTSTGCRPYFGCPKPQSSDVSFLVFFKYPTTPAPCWFSDPYSTIRNTLPYFAATSSQLPTLHTLTCWKRTRLLLNVSLLYRWRYIAALWIPFISSETRHELAHGHTRILSMPPPSGSTTLLSWGPNLESGPKTGWRSSWFGYFPGRDSGIALYMIHKRFLPHLTQFLICKSAKAIISYEVKNSIWNITRGNNFVFSVQRTYNPCGSLKSNKINTQCPINQFRHTN
jgi:hypothetical protein